MELHMLFSSFAFCLQFNIQEVKERITDDQAQFQQFLRAPAKIGPDTNSHNLVLLAARFWLERWLAVRTMPQDLTGCWNQWKLKALIPRVADSMHSKIFANDPPSAERRIQLSFFLIVLRSCGRKRCLNMWHGNSENSYGCSYLLRICFIYGTNVSVSRS